MFSRKEKNQWKKSSSILTALSRSGVLGYPGSKYVRLVVMGVYRYPGRVSPKVSKKIKNKT